MVHLHFHFAPQQSSPNIYKRRVYNTEGGLVFFREFAFCLALRN